MEAEKKGMGGPVRAFSAAVGARPVELGALLFSKKEIQDAFDYMVPLTSLLSRYTVRAVKGEKTVRLGPVRATKFIFGSGGGGQESVRFTSTIAKPPKFLFESTTLLPGSEQLSYHLGKQQLGRSSTLPVGVLLVPVDDELSAELLMEGQDGLSKHAWPLVGWARGSDGSVSLVCSSQGRKPEKADKTAEAVIGRLAQLHNDGLWLGGHGISPQTVLLESGEVLVNPSHVTTLPEDDPQSVLYEAAMTIIHLLRFGHAGKEKARELAGRYLAQSLVGRVAQRASPRALEELVEKFLPFF